MSRLFGALMLAFALVVGLGAVGCGDAAKKKTGTGDKVDDGKVDDGKVDDGKVDDGKKDDGKKDDGKKDDGKKDDGKKDDGKKDDGKKDDGKKDDGGNVRLMIPHITPLMQRNSHPLIG